MQQQTTLVAETSAKTVVEPTTIEKQLETPSPSKQEIVSIIKNKFGYDTSDMKTIVNTVAKGANPWELQLFLHQCKKAGLDPLAKQIHFIVYGSGNDRKVTIQTSIDGFRIIAMRTNQYAGNDEYTFNDGKTEYECRESGAKNPITATATVYRIIGQQRIAFTATAGWDSYLPSNTKQQFIWRKMPYNQLGKCAEALALRKAFPQDLGGMYTDDELQQAQIINGTIDDQLTKRRQAKHKKEASKKTDWKDAFTKQVIKRIQGDETFDDCFKRLFPNSEFPLEQAEAQVMMAKLLRKDK